MMKKNRTKILEDGSLVIICQESLVSYVNKVICEYEKYAKRCHSELTVDCSMTKDGLCKFHIISSIDTIKIEGYSFLGVVIPVETREENVALDAIIIPNTNYVGNSCIINTLKSTQAKSTCDLCHKSMRRGTYFVFIKDDTQELVICGKNCAKNYFGVTLTDAQTRFLMEVNKRIREQIFIDNYGSDEEILKAIFGGKSANVETNVCHNFNTSLINFGKLFFGIAKSYGELINPKLIPNFEEYCKYLYNPSYYIDPTVPSTMQIAKQADNYCSIFDETFHDENAFFNKLYEYYNNLNVLGNDFMSKLKQYSQLAEHHGFVRNSSVSPIIVGWVIKKFLEANPEYFNIKEQTNTTEIVGEYPNDGDKICGDFTVTKILYKKDDKFDEYSYTDSNVIQNGIFIKDNKTNLTYYLKFTKSEVNYGGYTHIFLKPQWIINNNQRTFSIGEVISIRSAKVKKCTFNDGRELYMLTYVKLNNLNEREKINISMLSKIICESIKRVIYDKNL